MTLSFAAHPARPAEVAEWEDLLVRLEIMPRALRNVLEGVPGETAAALAALRALVDRERLLHAWFRALLADAAADVPGPDGVRLAAGELADWFTRLRARTFAMVQRRGLEVWEWEAELAGHGRVSSFQLLCEAVRQDVGTLAELRRAGAC
jgi:hypothetical protein